MIDEAQSNHTMKNYVLDFSDKAKLEQYYRDEVHRKIEVLENALNHINNNGQFAKNIKQILNSCMQIMDLGMIHGYEGVEAIAERMFNAARYCAWQGDEALGDVHLKLREAVGALKQVVDITDPLEAKKLIDKAKVDMDFRIDDLLSLRENDEEDIWTEPVRPKSINDQNQIESFEIKEFTAIPQKAQISQRSNGIKKTILNEEKISENLEWPDLRADETEEGPDSVRAFEEGEIEMLVEGLDEILIQKVHEALDRLLQSIQELETDRESTLAIQDIKEACLNLKEMSLEIQLQPMSDIIYPMAKIATENLESDDNAGNALALLRECTEIIREFIDTKKISTATMLAMKNKIRDFENVITFSQAKNQDAANIFFDEEEPEIPEPPRLPFIVRLKQLFGMY